MSLLLQCVNFHISTVYSFVGPSSMKGFWVHYIKTRIRLDGKGPVGPCLDLHLVAVV